MPNGAVKEEWLKSVCKELKTLVDSGTFLEDVPHAGETSTPVMEIFKRKKIKLLPIQAEFGRDNFDAIAKDVRKSYNHTMK